jgi:Cu-Zn family superoxide dismutase
MRAILVGILLAMATMATIAFDGEQAKATLKSADGQTVGDATLTETPHGVLIHVNLTKVTPGVHAFHIHDAGKCEPPFTSAGGHFNPTKRQHGVENAMGMHAGDLPNITVPSSGALTFEVIDRDVSLKPGANSLSDADGAAIVIHDKADDYKTDPAGSAGDRVICGVIMK